VGNATAVLIKARLRLLPRWDEMGGSRYGEPSASARRLLTAQVPERWLSFALMLAV